MKLYRNSLYRDLESPDHPSLVLIPYWDYVRDPRTHTLNQVAYSYGFVKSFYFTDKDNHKRLIFHDGRQRNCLGWVMPNTDSYLYVNASHEGIGLVVELLWN